MERTIVCYEGPPGSSGHRVISLITSAIDIQDIPMPSAAEILQTVDHTPGLLGVIPIETSMDGELISALDRLIFETENVLIREEVVLSEAIDGFCVRANAAVKTVVSHPVILELSRQYIKEHGLDILQVESTAEACRVVATAGSSDLMALAPRAVGMNAGLCLSDQSVLDVPDIRTRFVVVGQEVAPRSGNDRTALVIVPAADAAGTLNEILACFANQKVNLLSILSRPLQAKLGTHAFYITCAGHITDDNLKKSVEAILGLGASIKLLGSFPFIDAFSVTTPFASLPLGSVESQSPKDRLERLVNPPVIKG